MCQFLPLSSDPLNLTGKVKGWGTANTLTQTSTVSIFCPKEGEQSGRREGGKFWRLTVCPLGLQPHCEHESGQIFYNAYHKGVFATEKQAKSALAMAQLSQIIANDERFGKPITDEEWNNKANLKFVIYRENSKIKTGFLFDYYTFLAFHTESQRDLFLEENEDLIRQYFMLN